MVKVISANSIYHKGIWALRIQSQSCVALTNVFRLIMWKVSVGFLGLEMFEVYVLVWIRYDVRVFLIILLFHINSPWKSLEILTHLITAKIGGWILLSLFFIAWIGYFWGRKTVTLDQTTKSHLIIEDSLSGNSAWLG